MTVETVPGPGIFATPPRGRKMEDIEPISRFLRRYQNLKYAQSWRHVENFKEAFNSLRPQLLNMLGEAEEQIRLNAPGFNLFRILHMETREDELHTPFLAELLDPRGAHGQKHIFLRAFINAMLRKHTQFPPPEEGVENHSWFVEAHKYIGQGTLDIVVSCPALSYLMVIENKIYAGEQEDQLSRYARWIEDNREWYNWHALIYLTPMGETSETADPTAYYTASYHGEIAGMLRNSLASINASHLRETILQYIDVISKL